MIDIKTFKEKVLAGTASIVRLKADFPEAAEYAVYQKSFDGNGEALPDEVTAIRKVDVDEFREKLALETAFLAELDAMKAQV